MRGVRNLFKVAALSVVLLLAGCEKNDETQQQSEFDKNYDAWKSAKVSSYAYNYEKTGFSPLQGVWKIQIEQTKAIDVTYLGSNSPNVSLSVESAPTIDSLYEDIKRCIEGNDTTVTILTFDENNSIPTEYSCSTASEGSGFKVSDFQKF